LIGLVTGIIQEELKNDYFGTLEKVATIGFQGMEFGKTLAREGYSREAVKSKLDSLGIQVVTMHIKTEDLVEDIQGLIEQAEFAGAKFLDVVWSPCETKEQVLEMAKILDTSALILKEHGFVLTYHNHHHEFLNMFDGVRAIKILVENTKELKFQVDVCWAKFGGVEPETFISHLGKRCAILHMKDLRNTTEIGDFIEVGDGIVDFPAVIAAAKAAGVEWFIVEQDKPYLLSPMDSIERSYKNLKAML